MSFEMKIWNMGIDTHCLFCLFFCYFGYLARCYKKWHKFCQPYCIEQTLPEHFKCMFTWWCLATYVFLDTVSSLTTSLLLSAALEDAQQ